MSSGDLNVTGIYATIVTGHGCRKLPVYDRAEYGLLGTRSRSVKRAATVTNRQVDNLRAHQ